MAYDQSQRYSNLQLQEADLIAKGRHVLCAYRLKPKPGHPFLATASHVAAESSTGTNVEVSTTDDFTRGVDALVYAIDEHAFGEEGGLMKVAYPLELFDRNITDGRMMISQFTSLVIGNNQGMGDIIGLRLLDFYVPPVALTLFDGPAVNIANLWRILGRSHVDGGFVVGTIIKPKLGLRPKPFADAAHAFWLGGDFIKNDEPQGNQPFCSMKTVMPLLADAMKRAQDSTGEAKLFSANITADDPQEIIARGEYILETFGDDANHIAFLVDGFVAGPAGVTTVRRHFPNVFLHYHRAGHGAITSEVNPRGYPTSVHIKLSRLLGASGIHVGTMGYGKMEGGKDDRAIAYMIERNQADGAYYHQDWHGMMATTPIISGGMNALRVPGFFDNLGHGNVIMTAGGGCYGHIDGPAAGAKSLRQAYECWKAKADPLEWAKSHREFARAFESFTHDADTLFPNWRVALEVE
ncbi:MAG: ribulose-bisphosphate carboxylase [Acidithiobacillus sp.]|jgi:ribulose-bisphosphate carboxylase large chain|uniref:ribulose-bisphosphate carboxylase n=1 Tax=Acidithiobacillus sp. TaxID=1872118 RepID=UPI003CFD6D78